MDNTSLSKQNNTLSTLLKVGVGGLIVWSLLQPDWKRNIRCGIYQLSVELAAAQRRKAEQERIVQSTIERFQNLKLSFPQPSGELLSHPTGVNLVPLTLDHQSTQLLTGTKTYNNVNPDIIWRKTIIHPSLILVLGKRGSGKSALSYYLAEINRFGLTPYVVGVPESKRHLLPDWIGIVSTLEEAPLGAIVIVDESYLLYHARGSTTQESKEMSKLINLSRQKEQTIVFVSQESRSIDKNIASSANVIIFKEPGILQAEFERPELNRLAKKASEAFASINGNKQSYSYVHSPDANSSGLIKNELPSFWKPELGRMFAGDISPILKPRLVRKLTLQEKIQKAKEMYQKKDFYDDMSHALRVSKGTAFNYVHDYPYRK